MPTMPCPHCSKPAPAEADRCPYCNRDIKYVAPNPAALVSFWLGIANLVLFLINTVRYYRLTGGDLEALPLVFALTAGNWLTAMILTAVAGLVAGILGVQKQANKGKAVAGIVLSAIFLLMAVL